MSDSSPWVPMGKGISAEERVKVFLERAGADPSHHGWGNELLDDMKLVSATANPVGKTVFELTIKELHTNRLLNLHGGCAATFFDIATTTALSPIAAPGFWAYAGVSRTLNVTYLRPVPIGEVVLIESEVVHAGKRLCTIKGVIKRKSDGAVMAICEHGKVSIDPEVNQRL